LFLHISSGPDTSPAPRSFRIGRAGEACESRLAWIEGQVVKFEPKVTILDDGSGPARVYFPADLSWRRPYVYIGEVWGAQGVVGQYAYEAPYEGGYRLIPRFETDVSDAPVFLPVTGSG
jgi:hypothetical protein